MQKPLSDTTSWLPVGIRTIPVVVLDHARHAPLLGRALADGGIPCAEITLRTAAGLPAIEAIANLEGFRVGAGTVLNEAHARSAVDAGAAFLVSPGLDEGVWKVGQRSGIPVIPGVATATEAQRAFNLGATIVKFFPAATSGGLPSLNALTGPFPSLRFIPTGGIGLEAASAWLGNPAVLAVGGTWLTPRDLIREGRFDQIRSIARETVERLNES